MLRRRLPEGNRESSLWDGWLESLIILRAFLVQETGGDTAGQDALHSAGVEGPEDSGARSKLPQPSQEEETLMCLLQHCICVSRPCEILGDVNAEELKAGHPLHRCLDDGDGCVFSALSPVIHRMLSQQGLERSLLREAQEKRGQWSTLAASYSPGRQDIQRSRRKVSPSSGPWTACAISSLVESSI